MRLRRTARPGPRGHASTVVDGSLRAGAQSRPRYPPTGGRHGDVTWATLMGMTSMQGKQWRAGRFGSGSVVPTPSAMQPLRALVFDLDALTDIECDGHRVAYNAAFAAHDLRFEWSVTRYRQLLALTDERQRVAAELRKRCVTTDSDV